MNPPLWSVQTVAAILAGTAFAACVLYAAVCWVRVLQNRLPGVSRWQPLGFTGDTLNERGRRYLRRFWISFVVGVVVLLASDLIPQQHAMTPAELPDGPLRPNEEAVWEAVLAGYATHAFPSVGDSVHAELDVRDSLRFRPVPVVLLGRRDTGETPYGRSWLESISARSLVASVCPATGPGYCPGGQIKTYLELYDPEFVTLDTPWSWSMSRASTGSRAEDSGAA